MTLLNFDTFFLYHTLLPLSLYNPQRAPKPILVYYIFCTIITDIRALVLYLKNPLTRVEGSPSLWHNNMESELISD